MNNWQFIQEKSKLDLEQLMKAILQAELLQKKLLKEIINKNKNTIFGQKYKFDRIKDYRDFCELVPVCSYEDLAPYIQQIIEGKTGVLSAEAIVAWEMTGGSTKGAKLIPYTNSGLLAFQRSLFPWLADLLQKRSRITNGSTYWSISPVTRQASQTKGGIPIGLANDAVYFGEDLKEEIIKLLAVPPEIALIKNIDEWRYLTTLFLLAAEDLSLISVWSPTFLLQLVKEIIAQKELLVADINNGKYNLTANPKRAKLLQTAISETQIDSLLIWQHLDTISCWTDAAAKAFIPQLLAIFPDVYIQGKGLLATEGVVTLPLVDCPAPILAIQSAFYEFVDESDRTYLCHQLETDRVYRVIITTHSGLYRYDLGDRVRVRGWKEQTPLLEFVGRSGLVSDLCGEKLTEEFVLNELGKLGKRQGFTMLAPSLQGQPHYVLFLDAAEYDENAAITITRQLDLLLRNNPQYNYARNLGQLGELIPYRVNNPMAIYLEYGINRGQKLGNIKPPVLSRETGWEKRFDR